MTAGIRLDSSALSLAVCTSASYQCSGQNSLPLALKAAAIEAAAPGYLHLFSPFRLVHCTPLSFPNLPLLSLTPLSFLLQLRLVFLDLISSFVQMYLLWFLAYRFGECCCNRVELTAHQLILPFSLLASVVRARVRV